MRKDARKKELCHRFVKTGSCEHGSTCKFNHSVEEFLGSSFALFQQEAEFGKKLDIQADCSTPTPFFDTLVTRQCVLHMHGNGVVAVCVAREVVAELQEASGAEMCKVEFNEVEGVIPVGHELCRLSCDNRTIVVKCPLPGKLIEVNESLLQGTAAVQLLMSPEHRERNGYLALLQISESYQAIAHRFFHKRLTTRGV